MSETFLQLGGNMSAARLVFKSITGMRAVGGGQLNLTVEASSRKASADGKPLWVGGTLSVNNLGPASGYLGQLRTHIQPLVLPERGGTCSLTFTCDVDQHQLQVIEDHRIGPIKLFFDLSGHWLVDGAPDPFWNCQFEREIKQSDWITILEQVGYQRTLLLELPAPDFQGSPNQAQALQFFVDAQKHHLEHEWRLTVESLRQCLAALVGKQADEEDDEAEVRSAVTTLRSQQNARKIGYAERHEPVRQAMKFLCDLGAHPEAAETTKSDAYGALLMVAGLLKGYGVA